MSVTKRRPSFAKIQAFGLAIEKVESDYFKEGTPEEIVKTGDWRLWHKAIILFALFITTFILLVWGNLYVNTKVILCITLGLIAASIGFNVGHDANHGSFSETKWVNNLVGLSFNFLGVTSSFWKFKHNILHHTYTNLEGIGDDVAQNGILRLHEEQPWKPVYRLQPIYCWLMYGLLYIGWVLKSDFDKYFKGRVGEHKMKITKKDRKVFWLTKVFYVTLFWVVPIVFVGFKAWAIGYIIFVFTTGLTTAIVFQMAHIVEKVSQPSIEIATKFEWIAHQMATTANFATRNKFISWFVGGLNFQIEHHLFPEVSHVYYKPLSEKVKQVCKDFDFPYHVYPTFWSVFVSHFRKMVQLSKRPKPIDVRL